MGVASFYHCLSSVISHADSIRTLTMTTVKTDDMADSNSSGALAQLSGSLDINTHRPPISSTPRKREDSEDGVCDALSAASHSAGAVNGSPNGGNKAAGYQDLADNMKSSPSPSKRHKSSNSISSPPRTPESKKARPAKQSEPRRLVWDGWCRENKWKKEPDYKQKRYTIVRHTSDGELSLA